MPSVVELPVAVATAPPPAAAAVSPTAVARSESSPGQHPAADTCTDGAHHTRDPSDPSPSGSGDGRFAQYHSALQAAWPDLPRLTISYKELGYQAQVAARSREVPNLASAAAGIVQNAFHCTSSHGPGQARSVAFDALKGATGVIRPGDMTLILAPPGHGKSTLLKALAGRFAGGGKEARNLRGEVRWNGRTADELAKDQGPKLEKLCAFVDQGEVHYPMLTVRETLEFALSHSNADVSHLGAMTSPSQLQALQADKVNIVLELLGLRECADTMVGGPLLRGISGGQKRRLTLGELIITQARALFLDEVSTGLDSSATLDIVMAVRRWCKLTQGSATFALLQPGPEVFAAFDRVILLREGATIFSGSMDELQQHFVHTLRIEPNPTVDTADWLTEFITDPSAVWARDVQQKKQIAKYGSGRKSFNKVQQQAVALPVHQPHSSDPKAKAKAVDQQDADAIQAGAGAGAGAGATIISATNGHDHGDGVADEINVVRFHFDDGDVDVAKEAPAPLDGAPVQVKRLGGRGAEPLTSDPDPSSLALTTAKLVAAYRGSKLFEQLEAEQSLLAADDTSLQQQLGDRSNPLTRHQFYAPVSWGAWHHIRINLWRQYLFYTRSPQFVGPRLASAVIMGLVVGSVYYQLGVGPTDFLPRLGVAIFPLIFLSFGNSAELPLASEFKMVVAKQVGAGFYSPAHYVLSVALSHLPLAFIETATLTLLIYFLAGFTNEAGNYFIFLTTSFLLNLLMSAAFRTVAYAADNADVALNIASPATAFCMLFGGFLIVRDKIPDYAIWLYWLSPFSWALRINAQTEFLSDRYNGAGDTYLNAFTIQTDERWIAGLAYLGFLFLFLTFTSVVALRSSMHRWLTRGTMRTDDEEAADPDSDRVAAATANGEVRIDMATEPERARASARAHPNGDAQVHSSKRLAAAANSNAAGEAIPFTSLDLSWTDLRYTVQVEAEDEQGKKIKKERVLLAGIDGYAAAGKLTALMGSSGAGKTTLLDVLAGRKTSGQVEGKILINGHPQTFPTFQRLTAFCEQTDVHLGTDTVREALELSAALRLPGSVTNEQRRAFVDQILHDLELWDLQDRLIGDENIVGLSPGELKRLTIGVELASNPSILFLDEPTSGLDSRAALVVVRVIRKIASRGRAVICTIHQPSAHLLSQFDRMLLLAFGGRPVFFGELGEDSLQLVEYFQEAEIQPGQFRPDIRPSENPAFWMLNVIGGGTSVDQSTLPDWVSIYAQSDLHKQNAAQLQQISQPVGQVPSFDTPYARSFLVQFNEVIKRLGRLYFRDVQYALVRVVALTFLSLIVGLLFRDIDDSDEFGVISKMSSIFVTAGFLGFTIGSMAMPVVLRLRECFYKEQAAHVYSPIWHANGLAIVELPYLAINVLFYCIPIYFLIHFQYTAGAFFHFYAVMFLVSVYCSYLGQLMASLAPSLQVANILFSLVMTLHFMFGGVFVLKQQLPEGWKFMYYLSPLSKALVAVSVRQFECAPVDGPCPSLQSVQFGGEMSRWQFVQEYLSSGSGWDTYYVAYLVLMVVVMRIFATTVILKVSHYSR